MKQIQPFKLPSLIKFILLEQFPKVYFIFVLQYHHGFPLTSLLILSYFFNALLGYIALSFFGLNLENLLFFFFLNTNYINFCFQGLVKLADFGVATKLTEADVNTHSVVGTPYWMAPEVLIV